MEFRAIAKNEMGQKIKTLHTDNGGEYTSPHFKSFLSEHGILHQTSVPHTLEQNGLAERANWTVIEWTQCMLKAAGMSDGFQAEAVNTAVYLSNQSPSSPLGNRTPIEVWSGKKPPMQSLRTFGSVVWAYIPKPNRKKLDATSVKCIMLGYAEGQKAYHLWVPAQRKIIIAESVYFNEDTFLHDQPDNTLPLTELNTEGHSLNHKEEVTPTQPQPNMGPIVGTDMTNPQSPPTPELPAPSPPNSPEIPPETPSTICTPTSEGCPQRSWREPEWYWLNSSEEDYHRATGLPSSHKHKDTAYYVKLVKETFKEEHSEFTYSALTLNTDVEPKSYKEAMHSPHAEEWQEAIEDEKNSLIALGVFKTIKCSDVPRDRKVVGSKMVFKIK